MKKAVAAVSALLCAFTFATVSRADIPDPYGRPRPRPRPMIPVVKELRAADLSVRAGDAPGSFRLEVVPPGVCTWNYTLTYPEDGISERSEEFAVQDPNTVRLGRPIALRLPEEGKSVRFRIEASFRLVRFADTRFGPKADSMAEPRILVARSYALERKDGRFTLTRLD